MDTKGPMMVATALGLVAAAAFFNQSGSGEAAAELAASDTAPAVCASGDCGAAGSTTTWQRRSTKGGAVFISAGKD